MYFYPKDIIELYGMTLMGEASHKIQKKLAQRVRFKSYPNEVHVSYQEKGIQQPLTH